jgi:hypothetical protein
MYNQLLISILVEISHDSKLEQNINLVEEDGIALYLRCANALRKYSSTSIPISITIYKYIHDSK